MQHVCSESPLDPEPIELTSIWWHSKFSLFIVVFNRAIQTVNRMTNFFILISPDHMWFLYGILHPETTWFRSWGHILKRVDPGLTREARVWIETSVKLPTAFPSSCFLPLSLLFFHSSLPLHPLPIFCNFCLFSFRLLLPSSLLFFTISSLYDPSSSLIDRLGPGTYWKKL